MSLAHANPAAELRFAKRQLLCGHWDRLHNLIRELWPVKTSAHLAHAAGISQRAAELSLRERRQFASDTLVALLDTDYGADVLLALVSHSEKQWVRDFKNMWALERLKAERDALNKRIEAMERKQ